MLVLIDGENVRHGLLHSSSLPFEEANQKLRQYQLRALIEQIFGPTNVEISYYAAKIKLPKNAVLDDYLSAKVTEIREFTRYWVSNLARQSIRYVKAGYLKIRSTRKCPNCGYSYDVLQEKGVDVRLATDLVVLSQTNEKIALFSSDTDLIPAINEAHKNNCQITYVAFEENMSQAISVVCDLSVVIKQKEVDRYF